ncbi:MAG: glycosyltransferase family 39 protein, partial [Oscillospiraceae bacterium]|nr:glycosyltransferase family 39 protein [Oscillospiraceae bacterium]
MPSFSLTILLPVALMLFLFSLVFYYLWALTPRSGTVEWIHLRERPRFRFVGGYYPLDRLDVLALVLIVLVWVPIAFFNLGDRTAPESFHRFEQEHVVIDLGETTEVSRVRYFTGLNTGNYALYFSADGEDWVRQGAMTQGVNDVFKWREAEIIDGSDVRYLRLGVLQADSTGLYLGELAIYDRLGGRLNPSRFQLTWSEPARGSNALFDEQDRIPGRATFLNSAYFDEIYHARTAYEHVVGMWPYEISHPPLGKLIISIGIHIFGMTPFGWRFMGAFSGLLILLALYCLTKQMFGKRLVAATATAIFAASFMHLTQTRIATIDTYAVLFVLLMFWAMYRYISLDYETPFKKTLLPLFFAGLALGLGAASKWTSLFMAPVLALLWLMYQILRWRHYTRTEQAGFGQYLLKTILISCVFFLVIPGIIYYLSYIPYGLARGYGPFSRGYWEIFAVNQDFMLSYHGYGVLGEVHPFS